jgi:hypothetical protein
VVDAKWHAQKSASPRLMFNGQSSLVGTPTVVAYI